ncbi:hypothetical protein NDU88_004633 [Pleurodeles waltl]|uniref:Uncharacterized protein n=1 Tax=Pleurodeles waltl TaxID=8319 RepID=A0AAV7V1Z3_PLEWA|nr:hypothetical protein NDU88_004633 [Pleurodeles waltl]
MEPGGAARKFHELGGVFRVVSAGRASPASSASRQQPCAASSFAVSARAPAASRHAPHPSHGGESPGPRPAPEGGPAGEQLEPRQRRGPPGRQGDGSPGRGGARPLRGAEMPQDAGVLAQLCQRV